MALTLRKFTKASWEVARDYLWMDLVQIERTINQKFASVFGTTNTIFVTSLPVVDVPHGGTGQTTYNKGDLLVGNPSHKLDKLPVGTNAQVLTADSTQPDGVKWAAVAAQATIASYVSLRIL